MFQAVLTGGVERIGTLLAKDPSLVRSHYHYRTPLYFVVLENQVEAAPFLIEKGANPLGMAVNDNLIFDLASLGARNFLIVTVPDLGKTPGAIAAGPVGVAAASTVSANLDNALVSSLPSVAAGAGVNLNVLDTYTLLDAIVANGAAYGFTIVDAACLTGEVNFAGGTPCSALPAVQNQYVFWDDKHPTSAAQALVADAALAVVTPEPASWLTFAAGLVAILGLASRLDRVRH
jgi:phospholipase/lecithinase/hemolysin